MAKCAVCGAETELYVNGRPLCVTCDDKRDQQKQSMEQAEDREELSPELMLYAWNWGPSARKAA
jgi:hypothetical protein